MLYGLALFLPSIVNQLGFSTTRTQLLSVPPFAAGFACTFSSFFDLKKKCLLTLVAYYTVTLISSYLSDRFRARAALSIISALVALAGFALYLGTLINFVDIYATVLTLI